MTTQSRTERNGSFEVPAWAIVLAVIGFASMQVLFHTVLAKLQDAPPFPVRVFLGLLTGSVLAVWLLLIGYVNRDAVRRGMSRALWTLVAIFVPNGIGVVIYFILRQPLRTVCPQCEGVVPAKANFCPQCSYRLVLICSECSRAVGAADVYCISCGHSLRTPAGEVASTGDA